MLSSHYKQQPINKIDVQIECTFHFLIDDLQNVYKEKITKFDKIELTTKFFIFLQRIFTR